MKNTKTFLILLLIYLGSTNLSFAQYDHLLYQVADSLLGPNPFQQLEDHPDLYSKILWDRSNPNLNLSLYQGARRDTSYQDGYHCECLINLGGTNGYDFRYYHVQTIQDCENIPALRRVIKPKIVNTLIDEENDGVVTVSSQTAYPNSIKVKMVETNHMQQRNSIETRDKLNELFEGRHGSEFKLDKK